MGVVGDGFCGVDPGGKGGGAGGAGEGCEGVEALGQEGGGDEVAD